MATSALIEFAWARALMGQSNWMKALLHLHVAVDTGAATCEMYIAMASCLEHMLNPGEEEKYLLCAMDHNDKEHPSSHSSWQSDVDDSPPVVSAEWYSNFVLINGKIGKLGKRWGTRKPVHAIVCCLRVIELATRTRGAVKDVIGALTDLCDILGRLHLSEKQARWLIEIAQYGLPHSRVKTPFYWLYLLHGMQERHAEVKPQYDNLVRYLEDGSGGAGSIDLGKALQIVRAFDGGDWSNPRKIAVVGGHGPGRSHLLNRLIGARMFTRELEDVSFELTNDPDSTATTMALWYNTSESSLCKLFELPVHDDESDSVKRKRIDTMVSMGIPAGTMRYPKKTPNHCTYSSLSGAMVALDAYTKSPMWPIVSHVTVNSAEFKGLPTGTALWVLPSMGCVQDDTDNLLLLDHGAESKMGATARCMFGPAQFPSRAVGAYVFHTNSARGTEDHNITDGSGKWEIGYWAGYSGARMFLGLPLNKE